MDFEIILDIVLFSNSNMQNTIGSCLFKVCFIEWIGKEFSRALGMNKDGAHYFYYTACIEKRPIASSNA